MTFAKNNTLVEESRHDLNGTRTYEINFLKGITGRPLTYSDEDHLLSAGSIHYSYDLDGFLSTRTEGADVTTYDYSSRGELLSVSLPVAMNSGGTIYYLAYDQVGSLTMVADSAGTVVKQTEYDTFGNIISDSNPGFEVP